MIKAKRCNLLLIELCHLVFSPKGICLLLAASAINMTYLSSIRNVLGTGERMSILTPMLMIWCSRQVFPSSHFFLSTFTFFLLSQVPQIDKSFPYQMIRTTRYKWLCNQLFLIIFANVCLIILYIVIAVLVMLPHISLSPDWDKNLQLWQDLQIGSWTVQIPYAVVYRLSQPQAFLCASVLWWLYSSCGSLLMLVVRLAFPKVRSAGLGIVFCIYFYDYLCEYSLPYTARWLSPVSLSRMSYLNWGYDPRYPTFKYAVVFFSCSCVILTVLAFWFGKRTELNVLSSRADK